MGSPTQDVPGYYVWQISGKPVEVHLHLDVLDRLASEIMRGFGAVPKRAAEVGGLLLGTIQPGSPSIVRIEDYEPVPCHYRRGPPTCSPKTTARPLRRPSNAPSRTRPELLMASVTFAVTRARAFRSPRKTSNCSINSFPAPLTSRFW